MGVNKCDIVRGLNSVWRLGLDPLLQARSNLLKKGTESMNMAPHAGLD